MDTAINTKENSAGGILKFIKSELKPKGSLLTPFNIITAPIILISGAFYFKRMERVFVDVI